MQTIDDLEEHDYRMENTTPLQAKAIITLNEVRHDANRPYRQVRIQLPNDDEYELTFDLHATEPEMLCEPLRVWRVI